MSPARCLPPLSLTGTGTGLERAQSPERKGSVQRHWRQSDPLGGSPVRGRCLPIYPHSLREASFEVVLRCMGSSQTAASCRCVLRLTNCQEAKTSFFCEGGGGICSCWSRVGGRGGALVYEAAKAGEIYTAQWALQGWSNPSRWKLETCVGLNDARGSIMSWRSRRFQNWEN